MSEDNEGESLVNRLSREKAQTDELDKSTGDSLNTEADRDEYDEMLDALSSETDPLNFNGIVEPRDEKIPTFDECSEQQNIPHNELPDLYDLACSLLIWRE